MVYPRPACSEGEDLAGPPTDSSSPRALQALNARSTLASGGQRRRRTIYIAGMLSSRVGQCREVIIISPGRPPWYDSQGQIAEAFVIGNLYYTLCVHGISPAGSTGLAGGSASGKTTVARRIIESLGVPWVSLLSMDSFYKVASLR